MSNCISIGESAFNNCVSLKQIGSLEKVINIEDGSAFSNCSNLHIDLNMPSASTISGSFQYSGITSISNLGNVTKLHATFFSCKSLKTVILPESLILLEDNVFNRCSSLIWVKLMAASVVSLPDSYSFSDTNNCSFYVPDDLVDSYKVATNWSIYASRIFSLTQFATDFPNG